ncbi:MAG: ABC transporter permease, partial [Muribaculaceae bacterium]|nr:ABC transporter permease [Muribaculaceae bacterium]
MSIKRYFRQAWGSLVKQPLLSAISVGGTALAIFLIMIIVMIDEVKVAPFAPESNRDRWLIQVTTSLGNKDWGSTPERNSSSVPMAYYTIRRTFYEMSTPEAVTAFTPFVGESHLSVKGKTPFGAKLRGTDDGFWKVMDFTFVSGHPYEKASVEAGNQVAVLSESLARKLFDTSAWVGQDFMIDHVSYRVCG